MRRPSRWNGVVGTVLAAWLTGAAAVPVSAQQPLPAPPIRAAALYLVEVTSGTVLLSKQATRRLPPASLTKIMTALVAAEAAAPQHIVKIDGRALGHRSSLKLKAGEEFALRDLLTAMLVTSANDACEAIAWHVGGTAGRFVDLMNQKAVDLHLRDTHFENACGFDGPTHYSTAADLAVLTQAALAIPDIAMMVRTVHRQVTTADGSRAISLYSTNELLRDPEVTGVKTGYTSQAGRCLIASMFKDGRRMLLVGLNVQDQWEQATELLRYGYAKMASLP